MTADDVGADDAALRVEVACEVMHDAYEAAAVGAGWETQQASRKPWIDVPEANKATMRAAVAALFDHLAAVPQPVTQPEGTTATEWGVRSQRDGDVKPLSRGSRHEAEQVLAFVTSAEPPHPWDVTGPILARQRTSYPDHVTDWEPTND